jgi:hypothetical protein
MELCMDCIGGEGARDISDRGRPFLWNVSIKIVGNISDEKFVLCSTIAVPYSQDKEIQLIIS